ncbi:MAG: hypothetical protein Q9167_004311 [Letrouitia subvulpina]
MAARAAYSEIDIPSFVMKVSQNPGVFDHDAESVTTARGQEAPGNGPQLQKGIRQYFRPVTQKKRKDDIRSYFKPAAAPARPARTQNLDSSADAEDRMDDGKPNEEPLAKILENLVLAEQKHGPKSSSKTAAHEQWAEAMAETPLSGNALESKVSHRFGSAEACTTPDAFLQHRALLTVPNIDFSKTSSSSFRTDAGKTPIEPPAYNQTRSPVLPGFDPTFEFVSGELPSAPFSPRITDVVDHTLVPPPLEPKTPHSPSTISDLRLRIINAALKQDAKNNDKQLPATPKIRAQEEKKKRKTKQSPSLVVQWQKYREEKFGSSAVAGSVRPGISPNRLKSLPPSDRSISMSITPTVRIHSPRGPCPMPSIDHTLRSHSDRDVLYQDTPSLLLLLQDV